LMVWQGGHHEAQYSRRTGFSEARTFSLNCLSVISIYSSPSCSETTSSGLYPAFACVPGS
jgi:hypothetical protein